MKRLLQTKQELHLNQVSKPAIFAAGVFILVIIFGVIFLQIFTNIRHSDAGVLFSSKSDGKWNSSSIWQGGSNPGSANNIEINHKITIPQNVQAICNRLDLTNGRLTLEKGASLTVRSSMAVNAVFGGSRIELEDDATITFQEDVTIYSAFGLSRFIMGDSSKVILKKGISRSELVGLSQFLCSDEATVVFNGDSTQQIPATGNSFRLQNVVIRNNGSYSPHINLGGDVTINNTLQLDSGIVETSTSNTITIADGGYITGYSDVSYIDGPVAKSGNDDFTFQFKTANGFVKLGIENLSADATFMADYNHSTPGSIQSLQSGLARVSEEEYWDLTRVTGTASTQVKLYWNDADSSGIQDLNDLVVAHYNSTSGNWENVGRDTAVGNTGTGGAGYILSNPVSSFSPFTFGSGGGTNPLPVELTEFKASPENERVILTWITASEKNNDHFLVQRSIDGESFSELGTVKGAGTTFSPNDYTYTDHEISPQTMYYRLKQVDFDGTYEYSPVIAVEPVNKDVEPIRINNFGPNPFKDNFHVQLFSEEEKPVKIILISVNGQVEFSERLILKKGVNEFHFDEGEGLKPGTYILDIYGNDISLSTKLIKRKE